MRENRLLWRRFLDEAFTNWAVILPLLASNLLGLIVFSFGFKQMVGEDYAVTLALGWISFSMVGIGVASTIVMTADLTVTQIRYLLSLPVTLRAILIGKIGSVAVLAFCVSLLLLVFGQIVLLHAPIEQLGFLFAALVLQALTLIGILSSVAACVRSLPRLAILTNFLIAALHYVSVVYFPIDVLPIYVRPLLYLNPLTYAINFSRGILLRGDVNLAPLGALIGWCCVWSMLGYLGLRRRIQRLR